MTKSSNSKTISALFYWMSRKILCSLKNYTFIIMADVDTVAMFSL